MVKEGNKQVRAVLNPRSLAKLQYIKQETGLKDTSVITLAIDYYYNLMKGKV